MFVQQVFLSFNGGHRNHTPPKLSARVVGRLFHTRRQQQSLLALVSARCTHGEATRCNRALHHRPDRPPCESPPQTRPSPLYCAQSNFDITGQGTILAPQSAPSTPQGRVLAQARVDSDLRRARTEQRYAVRWRDIRDAARATAKFRKLKQRLVVRCPGLVR